LKVAYKDWPTLPRSDEQIERVAHSYRLAADSGDEWAPNILDLIERLSVPGRPLFGLRIVVRPDNELPDDEAIAKFDARIVEVRKSVNDGARAGHPRCRMTLAHELGHIALDHRGAPKSRKPGGGGREAFISASKSAERQATVFAAAFLMPRAQVRQCKSPDEVARRLKVSGEAAEIRFEQVNVRDIEKKTPAHIAAAIERLKASVGVSGRRPPPESVLSPEQQAKLAWETADEMQNLDPREFRCIDRRWVIRWSRLNVDASAGWGLFKGRIVPWDSEN
jgi:hypothetical protein